MKRIGLAVFILVIMMGVWVNPAGASVTRWATWQVDMDFAGNKINGSLTVTLAHDGGYGTVVDDEMTVNLVCRKSGAVPIIAEEAIFDGNGYIWCDMPNLGNIVDEMSEGSMQLAGAGEAKNPWAMAEVALSPGESLYGSNNPLYYQEALQFDLPMNHSGTSMEMHLAVAGYEIMSMPFTVGGMQDLYAGWHEFMPSTYQPEFSVNGGALGSVSPAFGGSVTMPVPGDEIYIGYSPATGEYFEGVLTALSVDPGCPIITN